MTQDAKPFAAEVVRTLRRHGHNAYLVGGCVRDLLLGREPADYDVATSATPGEVMQIFPETWAVGAQFGVVLVPVPAPAEGNAELREGATQPAAAATPAAGSTGLSDESAPARKQQVIEVATFRCDVGYSDGRHPDQVRYSKVAREDVERRDFTINGLLLDPETNEVLDFVGGRKDLEAGVIRTIGNPERRFAEDRLRMLRAVRFAARFEYQIAAETQEAIRRHKAGIHQVSRERVRDELSKMLTEGRARRAFELLDETGLLEEVLPEVAAMKGVEQPPQFHPEGDVFVHTMLLLEKLPPGSPLTLAWGALLHDVGKPPTFRVGPDRIRFDGHVEVGVKMAEAIARRLRFANDETEQILALVENHMRFGDAPRMKESTLKKFIRLPRFHEHLQLHWMDCTSSHRDLGAYEYVRERMESLKPEEVRPEPLVSGRDLIGAGYQPGPQFKAILGTVEDLQLERKLATREEAMEYIRREFPLQD